MRAPNCATGPLLGKKLTFNGSPAFQAVNETAAEPCRSGSAATAATRDPFGYFLFSELHASRFQPALELTVHADQAVGRAADDPQHAQPRIRFGVECGKRFREHASSIGAPPRRVRAPAPRAATVAGAGMAESHMTLGRAERADPRKLVEVVQPTYSSAPPIDSPAIARCSRFLLTL